MLPIGPWCAVIWRNSTARSSGAWASWGLGLLVVAGILGGIGLAFFASVASDMHSRRILERWQLERLLGVRVLAEFRRRTAPQA